MPWNESLAAAPVLDALAPFEDAITAKTRGEQVGVIVDRTRLVEVCRFLKERLQFDLLVAETAVDWFDWLDVTYLLRSTSQGHEFAFTVQVERESAIVPSIAPVWSAAIWMERETYDLMGVKFDGHPDLRRILTWDEFEGHPLRKDFGLGKDRAVDYDQVPPGYKKVGEE